LRNPFTPQSGDSGPSRPSAEDSALDLLVDTLDGLDEPVRGNFLRVLFHTIAQIDLSDAQSLECWKRILNRRRELSENIGKTLSLKTAIVDVLACPSFMRVPILVEYEDFKTLQINAATDALTGLYNRRLFDEYCDKEVTRAKRYVQQLAVAILDLHELKEVNDQRGHLQGDEVLQLVAATLRKTLRASDFSFRIGGDEFALLLPQTNPEQAITLCHRIRSQYELDISPLGLDIGVTLDFGVAVHPIDGDQKSALMNIADQRLYRMKLSGRAKSDVRQHPPVPSTQAVPSPRENPEVSSIADAQQQRGFGQPAAAAVPSPTAAPAPTPITAKPRQTSPQVPGAESPKKHRRWIRTSLVGTKAFAILIYSSSKDTATVTDLSYGGVTLLLDDPDEVPVQFTAVLHIPILPPVRVVLRKVYTQRMFGGGARIGCSFVS
jgi:diguanylate cyclase (GGDEF)-like protein